jgi:hypothetical protein
MHVNVNGQNEKVFLTDCPYPLKKSEPEQPVPNDDNVLPLIQPRNENDAAPVLQHFNINANTNVYQSI